MSDAWHFVYDRQAATLIQRGLRPIQGGFCSADSAVSVSWDTALKIKRNRFTYSPVFFYVSEARVMASSHYLALLAELKQAGVSTEVDLEYAIDYLSYQCPWTCSTLCKQIQIVRNGEEVCISERGAPVRRFIPFLNQGTAAPNIYDSLNSELARLEPEKTAFHISSGLDSSLLVLLATKLFAPSEITAVSCETMGTGASDELDLVKRLAADVGFKLNVFDFRQVDVFSAGRDLIQQCIGYPIAHPSHLLEYLLDRELSSKFDVVVSGRGPDECLAGYAWHQPAYRNKQKYLARLRVTSNEVLGKLFKADLVPESDRFADHVTNAHAPELSLHDRLAIDQRLIAEAWGIVQSGIERGLGIHIATPFQNSQLTEAMFNLDESQMLRGATQKVYLRETMSPHYVDYLLAAPKRGFRLDLKPYLEATDSFLDQILDSQFADQYLDKAEIIKMHENTMSGAGNSGWQLWSLFLLAHSFELISN